MLFKRNQVEEAVFRTLNARDERRISELKLRLKRLLVTDRRLGVKPRSSDAEHGCYAFFTEKPQGSGTEVMFTGYEAYALLIAIQLLEHGIPQASVVRVMRRVREEFEIAHAETLKRDPKTLFDEAAIKARAQPGDIVLNSTAPVFLVFAGLTGSSVDRRASNFDASVCQGEKELWSFLHERSRLGATFFEVTRSMFVLANNLSRTEPARRGRAS